MASVSAVRQVLAARLETIQGLRVREHVSGEISPPAAAILPGIGTETSTGRPAIEYDKSFGRTAHKFNFLIKVAVSTSHNEAGQAALDSYLASEGENSIKESIERRMDALELDGDHIADYALVPGVVHYGLIQWGGVDYLGADVHVEVQAR
ncbi:hypothetical protein FHX37_0494 [Haloactinospora alba]|uniref:Uncharacterized protein n=1 Tax=Haloactinospora alba TaxID=405555 RepID=A0A543NFK1_9ACTN|nr:hypothetical protein [Haloactinospora alba]TQN30612.1 hypothetical protein FHX37_0494 [Haloactinospora alba]